VSNTVITFGGAAFDVTTAKIVKACVQQGLNLRVYDDRWLTKTNFYADNLWIFQRQPQHGFGFCSWKPYIIQHALLSLEDGDCLLYVDADTYPVAPLAPLFDIAARHGVALFEEQGCVNKTWIKEDCFQAMATPAPLTDSDGHPLRDEIRDGIIACGRFQVYRKGNRMLDTFLQEWKIYSLDPRCTFHEGSEANDDHPSFIKNSCEQSVLSVLAAMYKIPLHRTPDQNGWPVSKGCGQPGDDYPLTFIQVGDRGNLRDWSGSKFANVS
jgi:hypothetical protein